MVFFFFFLFGRIKNSDISKKNKGLVIGVVIWRGKEFWGHHPCKNYKQQMYYFVVNKTVLIRPTCRFAFVRYNNITTCWGSEVYFCKHQPPYAHTLGADGVK